MKIDNSPSPRKPPARIPLCLPSLITSVTTTLSNLSGHSWSPGCIPKLSRMSTNLTQFHTHSLVPFTLSSEPPPNLHLSPLLCVSPSSHCYNSPESTPSLAALSGAGYSHPSRITKAACNICVLRASPCLFQTHCPSTLKLQL